MPRVLGGIALTACALAALLAVPTARATAPGAAASSAVPGAFGSHMSHEMGIAGADSGAYVDDLSTGRVLFSERAETLRAPASIEKLYTATAALQLFGPDARLQTTVLGTGHLGFDGLWEGNLYLRGGGDPTFGSRAFIEARYEGLGASVQTLARELTVDRGIKRVAGQIEGDESYFDSRRGEPSSGYARPLPRREPQRPGLQPGGIGQGKGTPRARRVGCHELSAALGPTTCRSRGVAPWPPRPPGRRSWLPSNPPRSPSCSA